MMIIWNENGTLEVNIGDVISNGFNRILIIGKTEKEITLLDERNLEIKTHRQLDVYLPLDEYKIIGTSRSFNKIVKLLFSLKEN